MKNGNTGDFENEMRRMNELGKGQGEGKNISHSNKETGLAEVVRRMTERCDDVIEDRNRYGEDMEGKGRKKKGGQEGRKREFGNGDEADDDEIRLEMRLAMYEI